MFILHYCIMCCRSKGFHHCFNFSLKLLVYGTIMQTILSHNVVRRVNTCYLHILYCMFINFNRVKTQPFLTLNQPFMGQTLSVKRQWQSRENIKNITSSWLSRRVLRKIDMFLFLWDYHIVCLNYVVTASWSVLYVSCTQWQYSPYLRCVTFHNAGSSVSTSWLWLHNGWPGCCHSCSTHHGPLYYTCNRRTGPICQNWTSQTTNSMCCRFKWGMVILSIKVVGLYKRH